jgi:hypothetical protein
MCSAVCGVWCVVAGRLVSLTRKFWEVTGHIIDNDWQGLMGHLMGYIYLMGWRWNLVNWGHPMGYLHSTPLGTTALHCFCYIRWFIGTFLRLDWRRQQLLHSTLKYTFKSKLWLLSIAFYFITSAWLTFGDFRQGLWTSNLILSWRCAQDPQTMSGTVHFRCSQGPLRSKSTAVLPRRVARCGHARPGEPARK